MKMIIRCAAQAARERRDPRHGHLCGIVSGHSSEGWIAGRLIATCEGQSGGRHHAVYPEPERIENPRTKRMRLAQREELPSRIVSRQFVVQLIGLSHGSAVKHIGSLDFVSCREFMIHPRREVILWFNLMAGECIVYFVDMTFKS